jgi:hypothetical protein
MACCCKLQSGVYWLRAIRLIACCQLCNKVLQEARLCCQCKGQLLQRQPPQEHSGHCLVAAGVQHLLLAAAAASTSACLLLQ